jgi:hypothetical protein
LRSKSRFCAKQPPDMGGTTANPREPEKRETNGPTFFGKSKEVYRTLILFI